jgi:hypothetical protein
MRLVLSCTGVLVVGVTSVARERERGRASAASLLLSLPPLIPFSLCAFVRVSRARVPLRKALDVPFYRYKEMAQLYKGGVVMC